MLSAETHGSQSSYTPYSFTEAYICDEIITSRAGRRCRIMNTDAEGRMAMVDLLCHFKEKVIFVYKV